MLRRGLQRHDRGVHGHLGLLVPKEPAIEWFTSIPFGMNNAGMSAWFYQGDGLKLWEETYAPFNLVPSAVSGGGSADGGWFRKKINAIGDFNGLKMRIGTGLGGKVIARAVERRS